MRWTSRTLRTGLAVLLVAAAHAHHRSAGRRRGRRWRGVTRRGARWRRGSSAVATLIVDGELIQ